MISATDLFNKYKGQTVGLNSGDKGQCVGWFNVGMLDQIGVKYPIQGAGSAYQILTATNTRSDILEQVKNNPSDTNQKPSPGDWIIWGASLPGSGGHGHVGLVLSTPPGFIITADQNWGGQTVHEVKHDWSYITGWIHHKVPAPIVLPPDPCAGIKAENEALKVENASLKAQVTIVTAERDALQNQVNVLTATINDQEEVIEELENLNMELELKNQALVGAAGKWATLKVLIKDLLS